MEKIDDEPAVSSVWLLHMWLLFVCISKGIVQCLHCPLLFEVNTRLIAGTTVPGGLPWLAERPPGLLLWHKLTQPEARGYRAHDLKLVRREFKK